MLINTSLLLAQVDFENPLSLYRHFLPPFSCLCVYLYDLYIFLPGRAPIPLNGSFVRR